MYTFSWDLKAAAWASRRKSSEDADRVEKENGDKKVGWSQRRSKEWIKATPCHSYRLANLTLLWSCQLTLLWFCLHDIAVILPTWHCCDLANMTLLWPCQHETAVTLPTWYCCDLANMTLLWPCQHDTAVTLPTWHCCDLVNMTLLWSCQYGTSGPCQHDTTVIPKRNTLTFV